MVWEGGWVGGFVGKIEGSEQISLNPVQIWCSHVTDIKYVMYHKGHRIGVGIQIFGL